MNGGTHPGPADRCEICRLEDETGRDRGSLSHPIDCPWRRWHASLGEPTLVWIARFAEDSIGGVFASEASCRAEVDRLNKAGDSSMWAVECWEVEP